MMRVKLHFNQKCSFKMGKHRFEVCQQLGVISVARHFDVYESEDAVSICGRFGIAHFSLQGVSTKLGLSLNWIRKNGPKTCSNWISSENLS
jgi:hypothetical protein